MPAKKDPEKGQHAKLQQEIRDLKDDNTLLNCEVERQKDENAAKQEEFEQAMEKQREETKILVAKQRELEEALKELAQTIAHKDGELEVLEEQRRKESEHAEESAIQLECTIARKDTELEKQREENQQKAIQLEQSNARLKYYDRLDRETQQINEDLAHEKETNGSLHQRLQESEEQLFKVRELNGALTREKESMCEELDATHGRYKTLELKLHQKEVGSRSDKVESSLSTSRINMPTPRIDKFEGTNWEGFISQFTSLADYFEWSPREKLFQLLHHVAGDARQFVFMKCDGGVRSSYKTLETALKQRFGSSENRDTFKAQLEALKFGPRDSLAEFCTDIAFLVRQAYPYVDDKTRAEIEVDYFVKSLGDPGMIRTVGNQAPDNLETARRLAETYMRLEDQMRPRKNLVRQVTFQEPNKPFVTEVKLHQFGEDLVKRLKEILAKIQKTFQPTQQQNDVICYNCQRKGHIARNCEININGQNRNRPRGRSPGRSSWQEWHGPHQANNTGSGSYQAYPPPHGSRNCSPAPQPQHYGI